MNKHTFYTRFLKTGEDYAATLDGAGLIAFNDFFDPLATIAAHALGKTYERAQYPVLRLKRKLRRVAEVKATAAARKERLRARKIG